MCENSQWGHCVRIFLWLTQSHPIAPPPARAEPGAEPGRSHKNAGVISGRSSAAASCFNPALFAVHSFHKRHPGLIMGASGCTVSQGGPRGPFFFLPLVEKNKANA